MALCDEYGVRLTDDDVEDVRNIADADGEVHRNDFILHIKNSRLLKQFEVADPASEFHWKKKADLAFRIFDLNSNGFVSKKEFKWMTTNERISHKKVDILFDRCDLDGDGCLNYTEFTALMFRQKDRLAKQATEQRKESRARKDSKPKLKPKGKSKRI